MNLMTIKLLVLLACVAHLVLFYCCEKRRKQLLLGGKAHEQSR